MKVEMALLHSLPDLQTICGSLDYFLLVKLYITLRVFDNYFNKVITFSNSRENLFTDNILILHYW